MVFQSHHIVEDRMIIQWNIYVILILIPEAFLNNGEKDPRRKI